MYKDNQDRVDAYLRGEMDSDARILFERDLNSYESLAKVYRETKAISDAIADRNEKLKSMARWDKEEEDRQRQIDRKKNIQRWIIGMSVAACIAVGFFLIKPFIFPSHSYEMPYFSHISQSFGEDSGMEILDSMINIGDYSNALAFADLLSVENLNHIQNIKDSNISDGNEYGIIKYSNGDSISCYDNKRIMQYEDLLYNIEWRRINLMLALGMEQDCIDALKKFSNINGIYQSEAKSLLQTLSK